MLDDARYAPDSGGDRDPADVHRVVLCSGKVSHDLIAARDKADAPVAVVRVEQLYPWPFEAVERAVSRYANTAELVWLQEEPENMGGWNFVKGRLYEALGDRYRIRRISRYESGSPAAGSHAVHVGEQQELLDAALEAPEG